MTMITAISLPNEEFKDFQPKGTASPLPAFEPLSRINIIVGSNNSGKSRFMRLLSTQKQYKIHLQKINIREINDSITNSLNSLIDEIVRKGYESIEGINAIHVQQRIGSLPPSLVSDSDTYRDYRSEFEKWSQLKVGSDTIVIANGNKGRLHDQGMADIIHKLARQALATLEDVPVRSPSTSINRVYIPILRGLRPLDDPPTDLYAKRTIKDYFSDVGERSTTHEAPEIFTGLTFYDKLMEMLLGDNQKRKVIYDYQKFLSKTFFEGQEIVLIPNQESKVVTVKIGDEADRPIYKLGEGVQAAIILSFLPYTTKEATFFFIEEPECHMHPGLQRKIIDFMASKECEQHMFFLTCHSNHLLDLTIDLKDVSVFTFRKLLEVGGGDEQFAKTTIEAIDSTHESSLELLGVRNSSVFLVNSTIWVEGITDRFYLRALFHCYLRNLRKLEETKPSLHHFYPEEDVHYCFVEYGGANLTHWSFLDSEKPQIEVTRLCSRAMVIMDQDGDSKLQRQEAVYNKIKERLSVLDGVEIENILPPFAIRHAIACYERVPIEEIPDFQYDESRGVQLGTFIHRLFKKHGYEKKRPGNYSVRDESPTEGRPKGSGTITDKTGFCDRALQALEEFHFDDLPAPTRELIETIHNFIKQQNDN